jgi:Fe-S-cluster containining protein
MDHDVFSLTIETDAGAIRARVALPRGDLRLSELAYAFLGIGDALTELAVRREARAGATTSCRKGCAACCRQLVPISAPEAFLLADVVAGHAKRAEIVAAFEAARARLAAADLPIPHGDPESDEIARDLAVRYFGLRLACPFLDAEACSIYPLRPVTCREYVVTTPRDHCFDLGRGPVRRVPLSARLSDALGAVVEAVAPDVPRAIPLHDALVWSAAHAPLGARRWPRDLLVSRLVSALSS